MNIYTTIQGDMWDSIAKKVYGTEKAMDILMKANPGTFNRSGVWGRGGDPPAPILRRKQLAMLCRPGENKREVRTCRADKQK